MKKIIFLVLFVFLACPAWAQEVFVNSGVTRDAIAAPPHSNGESPTDRTSESTQRSVSPISMRDTSRTTIAMGLLARYGGIQAYSIRGCLSLSGSGLMHISIRSSLAVRDDLRGCAWLGDYFQRHRNLVRLKPFSAPDASQLHYCPAQLQYPFSYLRDRLCARSQALGGISVQTSSEHTGLQQ